MGEFKKAFKAALKISPNVPELLEYISEHPTVTLIVAAKDEQHDQTVVIK